MIFADIKILVHDIFFEILVHDILFVILHQNIEVFDQFYSRNNRNTISQILHLLY